MCSSRKPRKGSNLGGCCLSSIQRGTDFNPRPKGAAIKKRARKGLTQEGRPGRIPVTCRINHPLPNSPQRSALCPRADLFLPNRKEPSS